MLNRSTFLQGDLDEPSLIRNLVGEEPKKDVRVKGRLHRAAREGHGGRTSSPSESESRFGQIFPPLAWRAAERVAL